MAHQSRNEISYFGVTNSRNRHTRFGIKQTDRLSHMYAIGKSGSIAQLRVGTFSVPEMMGQFAKAEFQSRVLVWVFGGFALLMGTVFIQTARRR